MTILKKSLLSFLTLFLAISMLYAQDLSVDYKNTKLSNVITDIQNKSGYNFIYNNTLIDVNLIINAKVSGDLKKVLDTVFSGLPISYEIMDKQVVLGSTAQQQPKPKSKITVQGTIIDDTGAPLIGVFVVEKGTQNGVTSDMDGKYSITVSSSSKLVFSCIGLADVEDFVSKNGRLDVQMKSDDKFLDEVVVVGYGVQKKANLTGAVSSVNFSDKMESRPVTTASSALEGLVPGLSVMQTSSRPGYDGATLRIRGNTTLNTNNPLVLVDGIEYSMDNVNSFDIETITVLKDASSTAIYGSRAANGVILITTKSGKVGQPHITYTCNLNAEVPVTGGLAYVSDYAESMRLVNEGATNLGLGKMPYSESTIALWENAKLNPDGINAYGVKNSIAYPNTDWFKELFHTGFMQKHNISLSGGTEKVKGYVSIGYLDNPGIMSHHGLNSGTKKIDIRANVDMEFTKWLSAGIKVSGERQDYGLMDISSGLSYLKMAIPGMYPGEPNKWGYICTDEENANATNIFQRMAAREGEDYTYRTFASAYIRAKLYKGLVLDVSANHNASFGYTKVYSAQANVWNYTTNSLQSESSLSNAWCEMGSSSSFRTNADILLKYNETFGKHEVGALAGYSVSYYSAPNFSVEKMGKTDWVITEMSAYSTLNSSGSSYSEWGLMSGFGRINYAYDGKYLFEANIRADGSSRFAPESRWGIFPSFSAGWNISRENWMAGASGWLDNLKIRASWGVTGNNNSGNYAWQSTYSNVSVVSGEVESTGLFVTALGNNQLQWETTKTGDIGLDFAFFANRLTGEIDGYIRNTSGILFRPSIYMTMGNVTAPYENIAGVQNKGIELGLQWRDGIGKDFSYNVGVNVAYNVTYVTKYKGAFECGWKEDEYGNKTYYSNFGDVAQSGFGGQIVEGKQLGDQYILQLYKGTGKGYSGTGDVDINAGPKDGMIRTESDMAWVKAMIAKGYKFSGGSEVGPYTLYYGDFIYGDLNGDGNYGDSNDRYFTGHTNTPKWTTSFTFGFKWKGIDFSMLLSGAFDFYLNWNTSVYNTTLVNNAQAISRRIADNHYYYNPNGDPALNNLNGKYPRLTYNKSLNDSLSDFYHYKGDYLKIKNIQIGYSFPQKWMDAIHSQGIRVFISGENLCTFTSYPGLDPEIGTSVGYPLVRTVCGGFSLSF